MTNKKPDNSGRNEWYQIAGLLATIAVLGVLLVGAMYALTITLEALSMADSETAEIASDTPSAAEFFEAAGQAFLHPVVLVGGSVFCLFALAFLELHRRKVPGDVPRE